MMYVPQQPVLQTRLQFMVFFATVLTNKLVILTI